MSNKSGWKVEEMIRLIREGGEKMWLAERENRALLLFREAAAKVPAYKDFLKKHKVDPEKITKFEDFELVPPTSKKDYLRQYSPKELAWPGMLEKPLVWTSTSGSTGEPFYFPRTPELDQQYSVLTELFLNEGTAKGSTLVIVGFGMGVWIGGIITYQAFHIASQRGAHPVSIITPGVNKTEIFNALRKLAPHFNQTVLVGYPPFIKDTLDEATAQGIDLRKLNMRLLFAAEAFNEKFRDYVANCAGIRNVCLDTLNIYGTADIGAMAFELPTSIFIRRAALKNQDLFENIFPTNGKLPTLAHYNPLFITFESLKEEILLTGNNAFPLIRYALGDHGGVSSFSEISDRFKDYGINLEQQLADERIPKYELPMVYVYERSDLSTKLYGAIIYPEHVREALQDPAFSETLTGKFTMLTKSDVQHNPFLEINIELKPHMEPSSVLAKKCQDVILRDLLHKNSEYANNYASIPQKVTPVIKFWPYEDPLYFKTGIKQKWIVQ